MSWPDLSFEVVQLQRLQNCPKAADIQATNRAVAKAKRRANFGIRIHKVDLNMAMLVAFHHVWWGNAIDPGTGAQAP